MRGYTVQYTVLPQSTQSYHTIYSVTRVHSVTIQCYHRVHSVTIQCYHRVHSLTTEYTALPQGTRSYHRVHSLTTEYTVLPHSVTTEFDLEGAVQGQI